MRLIHSFVTVVITSAFVASVSAVGATSAEPFCHTAADCAAAR